MHSHPHLLDGETESSLSQHQSPSPLVPCDIWWRAWLLVCGHIIMTLKGRRDPVYYRLYQVSSDSQGVGKPEWVITGVIVRATAPLIPPCFQIFAAGVNRVYSASCKMGYGPPQRGSAGGTTAALVTSFPNFIRKSFK